MKPQTTGFTTVDPITLLSPHKQCDYIKRTERNLTGLRKVLEIIIDSKCMVWNQVHGNLLDAAKAHSREYFNSEKLVYGDWTQREDLQCSGCFGVILDWFFTEKEMDTSFGCTVGGGKQHLADYLGVDLNKMELDLFCIIVDHTGDDKNLELKWLGDRHPMGGNTPFGYLQWPVGADVVVGELQKLYPDK